MSKALMIFRLQQKVKRLEQERDQLKAQTVIRPESEGFILGREYFRKSRLDKNFNSENPFEPGFQNYEDFWDGWSFERDRPTTKNSAEHDAEVIEKAIDFANPVCDEDGTAWVEVVPLRKYANQLHQKAQDTNQ